MKCVAEPTYKKYITGALERFDERNTGFSRGAVEGDRYTAMHDRSVENIAQQIPGKTILEHARWVSARTVDYVLRKQKLARRSDPIYNKKYRLRDPDPAAMTKIVKETARWLGADGNRGMIVGVAELNPLWIYTHWGEHNVMYTGAAKSGDPIEIPPEYKWVIVMGHEMGYDLMRHTPAVEPETDLGYSKMGWCASSLATFIAELGYHAIPAGNELGLSIPMAVDAGLGELGRNGLLITREFGPRVRISKVFTDLPLIPDSPVDIGVQKFCERCGLCAQYCPSGAIMAGPRTDQPWDVSNSPGMLKWPVKAMNCLDWWVKNGTHCSICIRVCPWNKPDTLFHRLVGALAGRNVFTRALVLMDELVGYGKRVRIGDRVQDPSVVEVESWKISR